MHADPLESRCDAMIASGLADHEGLSWVVEQLGALVHADPDVACSLAEVCASLADRIDAVAVAAGARYQLARVYANRGEPTRALSLIDEARDGHRRAGDELQALRTDLGRMHVLDDFGRHHEAVDVGERTITTLERLAVDPQDEETATWIRAATLENLGVAYGFTESHERALAAYLAAEETYSALGMDADLARVGANRGVELIDAGQAASGIAVLTRSAQQFLVEGDRLWYAKCLGHQATGHMRIGSYVDALSLLEQARQCLEEIGAVTESTRLTAMLADVSLALSLHDEALDLALGAAEVFRDAGMSHDLANTMRACGVASIRAGRHEAAMAYLEEAQLLFEEVGATASAAETTLARAQVLWSTGHHDLARKMTAAATDRLAAGDSPAHLALALMHLADLSEEPCSRLHLTRAAVLVDELGLPPLAHPLHLRLGRSYRRSGDDDRARTHLERAVEIIDVLQGMVTDESLRAVFLGDKRDAVDELADFLLCLPEPDVDTAFAVCDRARSRTLVELTSGAATPVGSAVVARDEFVTVGRELNAIYNGLLSTSGSGSDSRRQVLLSRAASLERELTTLRVRPLIASRSSLGSSPRLRTDEPAAPPPRSGDDGDDVTVLSYEVLGDVVHAFVARGDAVAHRRLEAAASRVAATLQLLDDQWSFFDFGPEFTERNAGSMLALATTTLHDLFNQLFAPIADLIGPPAPSNRVCIVPSGFLHRVPFHALHDGASHLVDDRALTIGPSATIARQASSVEVMSPEIDRRPALVIGLSDPTIPHAAAEARRVASSFEDVHLFVEDDATTDNLRTYAPDAGVIHLACHGLHRAENPLFSSVRLSDRWISAAEIMTLPLRGATVVLSACESGRQASVGAEPLGLTWAFLAAGASAVVVSLWPVQDDVAADVMTSFYRHLHAGAGHAMALQAAQQETARRWPHPYHWAPFALVGPFDQPSIRRSP